MDADTDDPEPSDNSATETSQVAGRADLVITKTRTVPAPPEVVPGQPVAWVLHVSNPTGPSTALSPCETRWPPMPGVTATLLGRPPRGHHRGQLSLPDLPVGASADVTVSGTLAASATGRLSNTGTTGSTTVDPDPSNNTSTASDDIVASADLSVTKTRPSGPVVPGGPVSWLVTVTNNGPSVARDVTLADDVDDAITGVVADGTGCSVAAGNQVSCVLGDLAPGTSTEVTISGVVPPGFTGTLSNTAVVDSPTDTTTPGNNQATNTGTAAPSADVRVTKTRTSGPVVPGNQVTWQLRVVDAGPSTARAVTVTDDVDNALTGVTATGPAGVSCTVSAGNQVSCSVGDLAPTDPPVVITVTGTLPASYEGLLSNTGQVTTTTTDPDLSNNTSTDDGSATPQAAVSIAKARTSGPVVPGTTVTWQVTVTNAGPSVARAVRVDDDVVDAFTQVTATGPAGTACTVGAANAVSCELGDLPPATSVVVTISARVPAAYTGDASNTATVSSPTDTSTGDDSATVPGTAMPSADVSITKSISSGAVVPGTPITWSLVVTNDGPSVARNVSVSDDVADTITALIATGRRRAAPSRPDQVDCDVGDLARATA